MLTRSLQNSLSKVTRVSQVAARSMASGSLNDEPKRVLVSGAAGQIAYSIVYRIAS